MGDQLDENRALLGSDLGGVKLPSGQCLEMGEFHSFMNSEDNTVNVA